MSGIRSCWRASLAPALFPKIPVGASAKRGTLPTKQVKFRASSSISSSLSPINGKTYATRFSPSYAGELRVPPLRHRGLAPRSAQGDRARRAALELFAGAICDLGSGVATGIANVAAEEAVLDEVCLTNEQGLMAARRPPAAMRGLHAITPR